jgi:hypothetical protein
MELDFDNQMPILRSGVNKESGRALCFINAESIRFCVVYKSASVPCIKSGLLRPNKLFQPDLTESSIPVKPNIPRVVPGFFTCSVVSLGSVKLDIVGSFGKFPETEIFVLSGIFGVTEIL